MILRGVIGEGGNDDTSLIREDKIVSETWQVDDPKLAVAAARPSCADFAALDSSLCDEATNTRSS